MIRNVSYFLYTLEYIGFPIIRSVLKTNTSKDDSIPKIGELLNRIVLLTQNIEKYLDINPNAPEYPETKLKIAALASEAISSNFETHGYVLQDSAIADLNDEIEFILEHLENLNFINDLKNTFDNQNKADSHTNSPRSIQTLTVLQAFLPVLQAIEEFAFGQSENKLIQNVLDKLVSYANELEIKLNQNTNGEKPASGNNSQIIAVLAQLYAETHRFETRNIMKMSEKARQENGSMLTIDIVWRAFDNKYKMLLTLVDGLIPSEKQENSSESDDSNQLQSGENTKKPSSPLSFYKKTS